MALIDAFLGVMKLHQRYRRQKLEKKSVPSRLYAVNSNQGRHPEAKTIFARACDEGRTEANENLEKSQIAVSKKNFLR